MYKLAQFYQIMYENLEEAITHKRFVPTARPFPSVRLQDQYAVEPWGKNTIELEARDEDRQLKTFYHAPLARKHDRHYATQRGFSFKKEIPAVGLQKPKMASVSRTSVVNPYNISGNILGEGSHMQKSMPFQLPMKKIKSFRSKERSPFRRDEEKDPIPAREAVSAMKRRISLKRQHSRDGFIHLGTQNDEDFPHLELTKRRSKIISLGYKKISHLKAVSKQHSMQLAVRGVMA